MKEILREIGAIARSFEVITNIEFKEYNLSKNHYIYLVRISEHPGIILEHLCDMIKVDRSTASRVVNKLVSNNYIQKIDENNTGKKIKLYVMPAGNAVLTILKNQENYSNKVALHNFSLEEKENMLLLLKKISQNLETDWNIIKKGKHRSYEKNL